jgi:CheY-like chemotaxis protein
MKKILFIDDDPDILESVRIFLESEGYEVDVDPTGSCLEELANEKYKPDLILLDVLLSGNDGRELTKRIKADQRTKNIPVILISAHPSMAKSPTHYGNDAFLEKPFDIFQLLETIKKLIG